MYICIRFVFSFFLVVSLIACTTVKSPPPMVNSTANDDKLIALTHWQLLGRMALKSQSDTFSANVSWVQSDDNFEFKLTNVFGVTVLALDFKDGSATLTFDGDVFTGKDPEQLIWRVSQWQIPIKPMQRWVKGLSNNQEMAQRDQRGLLRTIIPTGRLNNWQVDYTEYTQTANIVLPKQLVISRQQPFASIKFKVNQWIVQ